jgi:hypothetical protein
MERQRRLDGEARAPFFAVFDAEDAPLQRVQILNLHRAREPHQHRHERADVDAGRVRAPLIVSRCSSV